jgi:uncharacterized membrane protein YfcA
VGRQHGEELQHADRRAEEEPARQLTLDLILLVVASVLAGGIAAVTGFGIGSLLTPALALQVDTRLAVAAVSIPHVIGTAVRFWLLGGGVDRRVFWSFGLTSAAGGLVGALLLGATSNRWVTLLFAALLLYAALSEASGFGRRLRLRGPVVWLAGALSGLLGGLVGNQGGLRSAALVHFDLPKRRFVGTATAIALLVDGARTPVYLATRRAELSDIRLSIALATVGVVIGTVAGNAALGRIPDVWFHRVLAVVLALLGIAMLSRGIAGT